MDERKKKMNWVKSIWIHVVRLILRKNTPFDWSKVRLVKKVGPVGVTEELLNELMKEKGEI